MEGNSRVSKQELTLHRSVEFTSLQLHLNFSENCNYRRNIRSPRFSADPKNVRSLPGFATRQIMPIQN